MKSIMMFPFPLSIDKMVLQGLFGILHLFDVIAVDAVIQKGEERSLGGAVPIRRKIF